MGGRVQTISKPLILFCHNSNKGRNGSKEIRGMSPVELSNFLMDWQFSTHEALSLKNNPFPTYSLAFLEAIKKFV